MPVTAIKDTGLATRLDRPVGGTVTAIGQQGSQNIQIGGGANPTTVYHTGNIGISLATSGTDTTPVITETYIAEVEIPHDTTLTGIALLNGSAAANNIILALADRTGAIVAQTVSTAQAGAAAYQQVPFTTPYYAVGPAKYYVLLQCSNVAVRYRSHTLGNFGAAKKTGETFGTFTTITPPTTFTTALGPIADVY